MEQQKKCRSSFQHMCPTSLGRNEEEWPPSTPDLNPLDFGIWSYLESKVSVTHYKILEAVKVKLRNGPKYQNGLFVTLAGHF